MPGLKPVSRYQLALRDADVPRLAGLDRAAGARHARAGARRCAGRIHPSPTPASRCSSCVLVMWFCAEDRDRRSTCCRGRSCAAPSAAPRASSSSFAIETIFFILLSPIMWFGHTMFLAGLLFGREIGWIGQTRDDHAVPWSRSRCTICGRTRCSDCAIARPLALTHAGGDSLCVVSRRRARLCRSRSRSSPPGRGSDACSRASASAAAGGNRAAARAACAGAAGDRVSRRHGARGLTRCSSASDRARRHPLAAHLLRRSVARAGDGPALWRNSSSAAIWCSTSAPMSATASRRSAGSAPASSRSSRSLPCVKMLRLIYGREPRRRDRAGGGRPRSRHDRA